MRPCRTRPSSGLSLLLLALLVVACGPKGPNLATTRNGEFHAVGVPEALGAEAGPGRARGALEALASPFNCLGAFSDAAPDDCDELRFLKTEGEELVGAMKVPTLRNEALTAPYMHRGQKATLREVLLHYVAAPLPAKGHTDLRQLPLSEPQLVQLEAFLATLSAPLDVPESLLPPMRAGRALARFHPTTLPRGSRPRAAASRASALAN